jgi:hypothetical protein
MSNRIDQLFKGSLREYKIQPSAEAWTKVQAGLSKKNKIIFAWRLAAAILLFGSLLGAGLYIQRGEMTQPNKLSESNIAPEVNKIIEEPAKPTIEKSLPAQTATKKKKENRRATQAPIPMAENTLANKEVEPAKLEDIASSPEPVLIAKQEKAVVIEFTLETISEEPSQEVAIQSTEENSGLKKILDMARDVKNGDTDLGLREAKNQLFAFDFRKDKSKRN